jgi:hypothetical protein
MHLSLYRKPTLFVEHSLRPGDGKRYAAPLKPVRFT